jgi:hypothetical protein
MGCWSGLVVEEGAGCLESEREGVGNVLLKVEWASVFSPDLCGPKGQENLAQGLPGVYPGKNSQPDGP